MDLHIERQGPGRNASSVAQVGIRYTPTCELDLWLILMIFYLILQTAVDSAASSHLKEVSRGSEALQYLVDALDKVFV